MVLKTRLYNTPWAICPDALRSYERQWDDVLALAQSGDSLLDLFNKDAQLTTNDVGVMEISGPISRYSDFWSWLMGGSSVESMMDQMDKMTRDPSVKGILLNVNSPGGDVDGISELAGKIAAAAKVKPVVAYISGDGASAAYWLASAASKIIVNDTATVGSIGVYAAWLDYSKAMEQAGVKEVVVVSSQSPNKRPDLNGDAGMAQIQAQVDALAQVFVDTVARNRGVTSDEVLQKFGGGGVFIGKAAVENGLADKVGTFESAMAEIEKKISNGGKKAMTRDEVVAQFPEVAQALMATGAEEERKRIQAIAELETPENQELLASLKWDGKSSAEDAALAILKANKEKMDKLASDREKDAEEIPAVDNSTTSESEENAQTLGSRIANAAKRIKGGK